MRRKAKKPTSQPVIMPDSSVEVEKFHHLLDDSEYDLLVHEVNQPLPPSIRINPFKSDGDFPSFLQQKYGWKLEQIPYCPTGYRVLTSTGLEPSAVLEHKLGMFYIQESASMLPVELFSIQAKADEICLDLAASPGGKTTHLISRLHDRGLVIANDSSQGRIPALRIILQNWGAVGCAVTRFPGENYGAWYPDSFDKVLLDAPCSMQGLRVSESHALRPVTEKESQQLSRRQIALLSSALQAARVGGEVVYSTCTLLSAEDEAVVDQILKKFGASVQLLDAQRILPVPAPGITREGVQEYMPGMEKTIRLWPHRYHTAGFFACILQKTDRLDLPSVTAPSHVMEKVGFVELGKKEETLFCRQFGEMYSYDLSEYLEKERRVLVRRDQKVYLFPILFLEKFRGLPVQSAGLLLGEETPEGFCPAHEWVSRFGSSCQSGTITIDELAADEWIKGKDIEMNLRGRTPQAKYPILVNKDQQVLGRGKIVGQEIRNLFPRRLF